MCSDFTLQSASHLFLSVTIGRRVRMPNYRHCIQRMQGEEWPDVLWGRNGVGLVDGRSPRFPRQMPRECFHFPPTSWGQICLCRIRPRRLMGGDSEGRYSGQQRQKISREQRYHAGSCKVASWLHKLTSSTDKFTLRPPKFTLS